jgi:hypothetical protein
MSNIPVPPTIPSDANLSSLQFNKVDVTKGTVTQATSTTTGVTVNAAAGVITMVTSTLAANATEAFIVTNSSCSASSVVLVNSLLYTGTDSTAVMTVNVVDIAEGVFSVQVGNGSAAPLDGVLSVGFLIV